jgi:hypothetical protein
MNVDKPLLTLAATSVRYFFASFWLGVRKDLLIGSSFRDMDAAGVARAVAAILCEDSGIAERLVE